jgi:hypothetical protein
MEYISGYESKSHRTQNNSKKNIYFSYKLTQNKSAYKLDTDA